MDVASVLSDDDYDVVSNPGQRSLESSTADFGHIPAQNVHEPPPSQMARDNFESVSWTAKDIQAYVHKALSIATPTLPLSDTTKRVYVDGVFDGLNAGFAIKSRDGLTSTNCNVWQSSGMVSAYVRPNSRFPLSTSSWEYIQTTNCDRMVLSRSYLISNAAKS
ncbi:hypothetical protein C0995_008471 [Termitomyces sp. Mi166|nr:hypothetical protein C0995_008471 [Termitomyces sp. Mi166\